MALRGSICLYQGEELGLNEARVAYEDLQDPYGIEFWPEFMGRDGCRTPMVWEPSNQNGGFSDVKPWLPVAPEHLGNSVGSQEERPDALLHHYRAVIAMRNASDILRKGSQDDTAADGDVLTFRREHDGARLLCIFNLGAADRTVPTPDGAWTFIGGIGGQEARDDAGSLALGPWQYALLRET